MTNGERRTDESKSARAAGEGEGAESGNSWKVMVIIIQPQELDGGVRMA